MTCTISYEVIESLLICRHIHRKNLEVRFSLETVNNGSNENNTDETEWLRKLKSSSDSLVREEHENYSRN